MVKMRKHYRSPFRSIFGQWLEDEEIDSEDALGRPSRYSSVPAGGKQAGNPPKWRNIVRMNEHMIDALGS